MVSLHMKDALARESFTIWRNELAPGEKGSPSRGQGDPQMSNH